jgi:glucose/arabinose dehydrogenase
MNLFYNQAPDLGRYKLRPELQSAQSIPVRSKDKIIRSNNYYSRLMLNIVFLVFIFSVIFCTIFNPLKEYAYGKREVVASFNSGQDFPRIADSSLMVEEVAAGFVLPTSMTLLNSDDILVLEKNKGTVQRVVNGDILKEPVLDVHVANSQERGMLGIAVSKNLSNIYAFIYFTESKGEDSIDECYREERKIRCAEEFEPLGNRLYKYQLEKNKLVNPRILLDLPAIPNRHNGGQVTIGPDQNVYVLIGDIDHETQAQNVKGGPKPDGTSGINRVSQDGKPIGNGILGDEHPLNFYYAYGIRNSFGMDFDPITGNLWATENGGAYDEVNLVLPGFNSGWKLLTGFASDQEEFNSDTLVDFNGKGNYRDPLFVWGQSVGPTALKFLNSDKLGKQYENDMFVGDINNGYLYHFDLNKDRTGLSLAGSLEDKKADSIEELEKIIIGQGFGGITDIEVGPDGYLYILSMGQGKIFRILPTE